MSVASRMEQLRATVEELMRLSNLTERQKVKDILLLEARKIETEISMLREQCVAEMAEASSGAVRNAPSRCYDVRLTNYAWDQSDKFVKIYVTLKNLEALDEENVECVFSERPPFPRPRCMFSYCNETKSSCIHKGLPRMPQEPQPRRRIPDYIHFARYGWHLLPALRAAKHFRRTQAGSGGSFSLKVNGLDGKNYILNICNLLEKIIVEKSYWKKKGDTLIVFLAKKTPGTNWSHMTSVEKKASEPKVPKLNHSDDPSAGLMDMMKQMYQEGDDEMKRTIAKAWAESRDKQFPH